MSEDRPKWETKDPDAVDAPRGDIVEVIQQHAKGKFACDVTRTLAGVVEAVREHGGRGKIVLTISIELAAKFGKRAVVVTMDHDAKKPKPEKEAEFRFATDDGRLVRNDPDQLELFQSPFGSKKNSAAKAGSQSESAPAPVMSAVASLAPETRKALAAAIK